MVAPLIPLAAGAAAAGTAAQPASAGIGSVLRSPYTRMLAQQLIRASSRPRRRYADGGFVQIPFSFGEPQVGAGADMPNLAATARGMNQAAGIDSVSPQVQSGALSQSSSAFKLQEGGMVPGPGPQAPTAPLAMAAAAPGVSRQQNMLMKIAIETERAIRGQHPQPRAAIQRFIGTFGEAAFREFRKRILAQREEPRMVEGPGGPKGDKIPATIDGVENARLSSGEVVIPAPAVKAAGRGDRKRGALELMRMSDKLEGRRPRRTLNVERAG